MQDINHDNNNNTSTAATTIAITATSTSTTELLFRAIASSPSRAYNTLL